MTSRPSASGSAKQKKAYSALPVVGPCMSAEEKARAAIAAEIEDLRARLIDAMKSHKDAAARLSEAEKGARSATGASITRATKKVEDETDRVKVREHAVLELRAAIELKISELSAIKKHASDPRR